MKEIIIPIMNINEVPVVHTEWNQPENNFIEINKNNGAITFKIQDGPIKEVGVNGCQIDDVISFALHFIKSVNEKFPCPENNTVIKYLANSLVWLKIRKSNREERNVEGENKI